MTNQKDGDKTDIMSKRTLKTNLIKMCVKVKLIVVMCIERIKATQCHKHKKVIKL